MGVMYRSEVPSSGVFGVRTLATTRRSPANVPYVVDNLWEWKRPDGFPSRRYSAFASPRPELALESGPKGGQAYRVELREASRIAQVDVRDSRDHNDCKSLTRLLTQLLGQPWLDGVMSVKQDAGRLFIPCLTKAEIDDLFSASPLANARADMWFAIRYWEDVRLVQAFEPWPFENGEVFFTADQWRLVNLYIG